MKVVLPFVVLELSKSKVSLSLVNAVVDGVKALVYLAVDEILKPFI